MLEQSKIHFDRGAYGHGLAVLIARAELPSFDSFHGFLIETKPQAANHLKIARFAAGIHYYFDDHGPLVFGFAGFFGVFRLGPVKRNGSGNAATDAENAAAKSTAFAGTESGAFTRSHTAARSRSNTAARTRTVRRWANLGQGIAILCHVDVRHIHIRRRHDSRFHGELRM